MSNNKAGRPGLDDKILNQAISLWKEHDKSVSKAALSLGMSYATFYHRLNKAFDKMEEGDQEEFDIKPPFDPEEPVEKTVERMLENYKNNKRGLQLDVSQCSDFASAKII